MNDQPCTSCERMATAEADISNLQEGAKTMDEKLNHFQYWFMGLMGTSILTLVVILTKR